MEAICPLFLIVCVFSAGCQHARRVKSIVHPEARTIVYRAPESLPHTPLPSFSEPRTVSHPDNGEDVLRLSLDEAIRIALKNSEVVRVLTGFSASSSGQTIYDPGIANANIDQARGRFDPMLSIDQTFSRNDEAVGVFAPLFPGADIRGTETDASLFDGRLSDINSIGGTTSLRLGITRTDTKPGQFPLNSQTSHFTELSYVQPLLQGGGVAANHAPILIAGIETEHSFFQFKGSVQELVRGVIDAYWALVFARTDRWAREQQVEQARFALVRERARDELGFADKIDVAQLQVIFANFNANFVSAQASVLQREAALLNILGISPTEVGEVIPITPPHDERLSFEWSELVALAQRYRPDLVQLKLIIEADQQRLLIAENNAKPRLDAVAAYRWDGLQGRTPGGPRITTAGGEYTDWTLGVNFSVPLGLRQGRAEIRQRSLIVARDRANLQQGLHSAVHNVALSVRNQDQFYEQYEAFLEAREAAHYNLQAQRQIKIEGQQDLLVVRQAITDWGNSVSAAAQALSQYNTELANLELETGTILEAHGVRFIQEKNCFVAPCGLFSDECYPVDVRPTQNETRYQSEERPAEESFHLDNPLDELNSGTSSAQ